METLGSTDRCGVTATRPLEQVTALMSPSKHSPHRMETFTETRR